MAFLEGDGGGDVAGLRGLGNADLSKRGQAWMVSLGGRQLRLNSGCFHSGPGLVGDPGNAFARKLGGQPSARPSIDASAKPQSPARSPGALGLSDELTRACVTEAVTATRTSELGSPRAPVVARPEPERFAEQQASEEAALDAYLQEFEEFYGRTPS
jgi:hypothetical protein